MEQWIKLPSVRKCDVTPTGVGAQSEAPAKMAIRIALKKFVKVVNRTKGMGMKLTKVHSVLHVPDDVAMFGSGKNWDSGPSESNHKENVKRKAELTSLCKDTLEDQVASRFAESLVLSHARGMIMGNVSDNHDDTPPPPTTPRNNGSRIKLTISCQGSANPYFNSISASWDGRPKSKYGPSSCLPLPPTKAIQHLLDLFRVAYDKCTKEERPTGSGSLFITCFTQHTTSDPNAGTPPQIFRAHPSYFGLRAWNNSVYVEYCIKTVDSRGRSRTTVFEDHLSKLILFVDLSSSVIPNMVDIEGYSILGIYALVHLLDSQPSPVENSVILSTCTLSDKFYLVPTSSLRKPAFVVDNVGCKNNSLFVVPPIDEWASLFL
jgi:hypothetical protein